MANFYRNKSRSSDFLFDFNQYLNDIDKQKNLDFIKLFNYLITCFTQNSLRKTNYIFKKGRKYDFDYKVMEEHDSMNSILSIQQKFPYYRSGLRSGNSQNFITQYVSFMNESLQKLCTDIYMPVKGISFDIMRLIRKYSDIFSEEKKHRKSSKINYEVFEALGITPFSFKNSIDKCCN